MNDTDTAHISYDPISKVITTEDTDNMVYPGGLGKLMYDRMKMYAEKGFTAQIDTQTGKEYSMKSLFDRCETFARYLLEIGIKPGDVFMICTYSDPDSCVPLIAGKWIGAVICSTDPLIDLDDQVHLLSITRPKFVIVSLGSEELIEQAIKIADLDTNLIPFRPFKNYDCYVDIQKRYCCKDDRSFVPYFAEDIDETAMILFSSGTTSQAKAICLSHRHFFSQMDVYKDYEKIRMTVMAGSYWLSRVLTMFFTSSHGCTQIIMRNFDPATFWEIVEKYQMHACVVPNSQAILSVKHLTKPIPHVITFFAVGGPVPEECLQYLKDKLPNCVVNNPYGITETGKITITAFEPKYLQSAGIPAPNGQILKVVDPETNKTLGFNEIGELYVKSKYLMNGYYKNADKSYLDGEGFMRSGDLVYFNEEFYFFIVGRNKVSFKYQAFQISPMKIENVFHSHPEVKNVAVIGIPHSIDDHHAMAVVSLHENSTLTEGELLDFVNERLDTIHKLRAGVKIIDAKDMPLTPTGKVNILKLQKTLCDLGLKNGH